MPAVSRKCLMSVVQLWSKPPLVLYWDICNKVPVATTKQLLKYLINSFLKTLSM